jgi:hypothetical protein
MSDISDVFNSLLALSAQTIYPNGYNAASTIYGDVRLYAGWPNGQQLDADLKNNISHVSIYARPEEKNTTRYRRDWQTVRLTPTTITLAILNNTVTVGGTVSSPQNATLLVNGRAYSYPIQVGDTLTTIATGLVALISVDTAASNVGAVITIPTAYKIVARAGAKGLSIIELRRQERTFQIVVWTPTPALRDSISQAIDVALTKLSFLTMPDTTAARIIYKSSPITDGLQSENLYRRDLFYSVEYATTETAIATAVTTFQTNVSNDAGITNFTINQ